MWDLGILAAGLSTVSAGWFLYVDSNSVERDCPKSLSYLYCYRMFCLEVLKNPVFQKQGSVGYKWYICATIEKY